MLKDSFIDLLVVKEKEKHLVLLEEIFEKMKKNYHTEYFSLQKVKFLVK
jgi:hypothetical protein